VNQYLCVFLAFMPALAGFSEPALGQSAPRVPAEWELHEGTWMQWPKGLESSYRENFSGIINVLQGYEPVNIIVQSASARSQAQTYLTNKGVPLTNITWHIMPYNWAWMRDNGPVWANLGGQSVVQDWVFDGWGEQEPPWDDDDAVPCQVAVIEDVPCEVYDLINERGTLEFNGVDTLITSWVCLSNRNPSVSRAEMETLFEQAFGVTQVVWLLSAPSDDMTGGHVDGISRFIDEDTVVVARYVDQNDPDAPVYEEAATIIQNAGFEVVRLDVPGNVQYNGKSMAANYMNWLVANGVVVMCGFDAPAWDNAAKVTIEGYFPERDVFVVDTRELWYWGGGVHCVTNDQPARPGDLNCDGTVDEADIELFVSVLISEDPYNGYYSQYPGCRHTLADCDNDGSINGMDIQPFVGTLLAP